MSITKTYSVEVEVRWSEDDRYFIATHNGWDAVGNTEYEAVANVLAMVASFADNDTSSNDEEKQNLWMKVSQIGIEMSRQS